METTSTKAPSPNIVACVQNRLNAGHSVTSLHVSSELGLNQGHVARELKRMVAAGLLTGVYRSLPYGGRELVYEKAPL